MRVSMLGPIWLLVAGGAALAVALLHVAAIIGGPEWFAALKAPPAVVASSRDGTWLAPVSTFAIAAMFAVFGLYAFSAAGLGSALPLTRIVLGGVALLFLARGLLLVPFVILRPALIQRLDGFDIWSSAISFGIGLVFAVGAWSAWQTAR